MPAQGPDAAPHRRQRFIELFNAGDTEIPAWGVCEIVDSYRPDKGGLYTPQAGRTVMQVRRPTKDEPCATIVNGPCPIPVGEERRIGTLDDPLVALVYKQYDPQTRVGAKKDSYELYEGLCGWIIDGDYHVTDGTMRVQRYDECQPLMVKALECIKPGDTQKRVQPMKWDPDANCYVEDTDRDPIYIDDRDSWLLAITDDCFKVERDCAEENYRPSFPYGLTRRVKIKSEMSCRGNGEVTILKNDGSESECTITTYNPSYRKLACDADEEATLHVSPGPCCETPSSTYGWLVPNPRPLRAKAALTNGICGAGGDTVTGFEVLDVCGWPFRVTPTIVGGEIDQYACAGKQAELEWNESDCQYDIVNVEPSGKEIMTDLKIWCGETTCELQKKAPMYYVQRCAPCTDPTWETVAEGEIIDVPTGMTAVCSAGGSGSGNSTCSADLNTQRYCLFGCNMGTGSDISLGVTVVEVVDDVWFRQDGTDLKVDHDLITLCVLCVDATAYTETDTVVGTTCVDGP